MLDTNKRTWAEISIPALENNYKKMRQRLPRDCKFLGVVKANAYGHGAIPVARALEALGCDYLGVACLDEAEALRAEKINLPILILGYTPPQFIERICEARATQALGCLETALEYSEILSKTGKTLKVHLKLETGMGRTGFDVKGGDISGIKTALALPGFEPEGIFTHFPTSDMPEMASATKAQFELFANSVDKIEKESGISFSIRHCTNSGAFVNHPQMALNMVRPGIALYGAYPEAELGGLELRPVMSLKTRIVEIFDLNPGDSLSYGSTFTATSKMRIAVLGIGYADGLHRVLSGKMDVIIDGLRCPQLGRICMDMCMVDVTRPSSPKIGDEVLIFGRSDRGLISVNEQAEKAGTIGYELLCGVSPRVPRLYIN